MKDGYNWTNQAVYCYMRNGQCKGCIYNIPLESIEECQTKFIIKEILSRKGKPKENLILAEYGLKRCAICKKIKKFEDFHNSQYSYCAECSNLKGKIYREKVKRKKLNEQIQF